MTVCIKTLSNLKYVIIIYNILSTRLEFGPQSVMKPKLIYLSLKNVVLWNKVYII